MITKEQYGEWRNHPATLFFRQFLSDRADSLVRELTVSWLDQPTAFESHKEEARGRILELRDMADVPYETIQEFYPEKKEDNAAEGTID